MGFDQGTWDAIGSSTARARNEATHAALLQAARHLRWEHDLSRRKTALRLGVRERWVKQYVDDFQDRQTDGQR